METRESGPKFSTVFSTTLKVLLALALISLIIGIIYGVMNGVGSVGSRTTAGNGDSYFDMKDISDKMSDEKPTSMPHSTWIKFVGAAVKVHCTVQGMTKDEVVEAVGKPTRSYPTSGDAAKGETWEYTKDIQKECLRYDGDRCVQYEVEHKKTTYHFSPAGHMAYPSNDDIFGTNCFGNSFYDQYGNLLTGR